MAAFNGSNAPDWFVGGELRDKINGFGGRDILQGNGGNDIIKGGSGDDWIEGSDGNDKLLGGGDADWLLGGRGNDYIDGGSAGNDFDKVDYASAESSINVNLATGVATDGLGGQDKLIDIEEVLAGRFNDVLIGGNKANNNLESFVGLAGDDIINGGSGIDRADYASDFGRGGYRGIFADLEANTVRDGFGDIDTVFEIEVIRATVRDDDLRGDNQDNRFDPLSGFDYIDGRGGRDEVSYDSDHLFTERSGGRVGIRADLREGEVRDTTGWNIDTLISIEDVRGSIFDDDIRGDGKANRLRGFDGDDFISGRGGRDNLQGENGQDFIFGGKGNDVIAGGSGNDILRGGSGADTFVFEQGADFDRVRDFTNGVDLLDVSAFGFSSAASVISGARQVGNSVRIELSEDDAVVLKNFQLTDLDAGDLII